MPRGRKKQNSVADSEPGSVVYGVPRTFPETITSDSHDEAAKDAEIPGNTVHEPLRLEPSLADILQRTLGPPDKTEAGSPRADNLAVLLEQGLKSADKSLLQSVLGRNDELLIRKTIELLPTQYVIPLIQHLGTICAEEKARPNKAPVQWLSSVLIIRSSYLATVPNLGELLRNIYVYCDQRTKHIDRYVRTAAAIDAAVNLVKQRISQKAGTGEKKGILAYNEPLDETDSDESDEEMATDESDDTEESDEMDINQEKRPGKNENLEKEDSDDEDEKDNDRNSKADSTDSD